MSVSQTIVVTSNVNDIRNHSNHFFNRLGTPLDLSRGQWEVAIKKMIYLNSFLNIINESVTILAPHKTFTTKKYSLVPRDADLGANTDPTYLDKPIHENFNIWYFKDRDDFYGFIVQIDKSETITDVVYTPTLFFKDGTSEQLMTEVVPDKTYYTRRHISGGRVGWKDAVAFSIVFNYTAALTYDVPPGNYEKLDELIGSLNNLQIPGVNFTLVKGLVHVGIKSSVVQELVLNNHLDLTLGFTNHRLKSSTTASYLPQLNRGRFAFFIYSNLVNSIRVGDMEVPLIDVISIPKREYGEIISLDVVNPLYSPVALKQVNEIEIMLATDSGETITFDNRAGNAKTLLVLHFQRVL